MNSVIATAQQDYNEAHVALDREAIPMLALHGLTLQGPFFKGLYSGRPLLSVATAIVMGSLQYQFWELKGSRFKRYSFRGATGATAMAKSFQAHWVLGIPDKSSDEKAIQCCASLFDAATQVYNLQGIFGDIPNPGSRLKILDEILLEPSKLVATAQHVLAAFENDEITVELAQYLAAQYPLAYADDYLKKAQLTLMSIALDFRAESKNVPVLKLTAAADYQVPNVLRSLGVLEYSTELSEKISRRELLASGSEEERAIRAATVLACDSIAHYYGLTIDVLDYWLWSQRNQVGNVPFHLTKTTDY